MRTRLHGAVYARIPPIHSKVDQKFATKIRRRPEQALAILIGESGLTNSSGRSSP